MRNKLVVLFAWWFLFTSGHATTNIVGPFSSENACQKIRAVASLKIQNLSNMSVGQCIADE